MARLLRVWAEHASLRALSADEVLAPLRARGTRLMVALTPRTHATVGPTLAVAKERGVEVTLWPLLEPGEGLWLHAGTVQVFQAFVDTLLDAHARSAVEVAFDLEPSPDEVRALVRGRLPVAAARRRVTQEARDAVSEMVSRVHDRGLRALGVVAPPLLFDDDQGPWEDVLGTPVSGVPFDALHVMLYTSLFEGYLTPVRRADARALLFALSARAHARFGSRVGVSLGLTGGGALGDERSSRDVRELAEDVAVVRQAGIEDIAVHGLAGMLARPPMECWLDALTNTPPASAAGTHRAALLMGAMSLATRALSALR